MWSDRRCNETSDHHLSSNEVGRYQGVIIITRITLVVIIESIKSINESILVALGIESVVACVVMVMRGVGHNGTMLLVITMWCYASLL